MTKAQIKSWHRNALRRIELRRFNKLAGWEHLSESDYFAYKRSIESEFKRLKLAFNNSLALSEKKF